MSALPCLTRVAISYVACFVFRAQARLGCGGNRQVRLSSCPPGVPSSVYRASLTHLPTPILLLGRAPRGRGRKHKMTPIPPPRLADVAPTPPKTPARKRGEEGTERMVQALTELLRRAQAPPAPRSRACEPSTPRRSRGRPPGRPAGPCRKKQQAVVVAEAAVTIPKPEPPPPVVPVKHRTGSWKCKEGPGPGPGTPKRGGQSGRGGRGGRGRGRGGLPLVIKFVSKAKKVKMGQLSLGLESGQGQDQHEESWQDAPQGRVGSGSGEGPCWRKELKLEEEGEKEREEEKNKEEKEERVERAGPEEEMMLAEEKEEAKLPSPPSTPPAPPPPPPPPPSPPPPPPPPPPPSPPSPGTRERPKAAHAPTVTSVLLIGRATRRHGEGPGGSWEPEPARAQIERAERRGEVAGRFSRVRHFVAVAFGNGLGKTAPEARHSWESGASCGGGIHCRAVGGTESARSGPGVTGSIPGTPGSPIIPGRPPLRLGFSRPDLGLCPAFPGPASSVRRPRSRRAAAEDAAGPEPRGRCCLGPLSAPRGVPRGPSLAAKPSVGQRRPEQTRAAAAPTRRRAPARHHVLRQVRLFRPLRLVHGAGVSPGGADPAPGPAPRYVPSSRFLHLPRGLCAVRVGELAGLPLHHQLAAQPPF